MLSRVFFGRRKRAAGEGQEVAVAHFYQTLTINCEVIFHASKENVA